MLHSVSEVSSTLPLKQFQYSSDWLWPFLLLSRKIIGNKNSYLFSSRWSIVWLMALALCLQAVPWTPQHIRSFQTLRGLMLRWCHWCQAATIEEVSVKGDVLKRLALTGVTTGGCWVGGWGGFGVEGGSWPRCLPWSLMAGPTSLGTNEGGRERENENEGGERQREWKGGGGGGRGDRVCVRQRKACFFKFVSHVFWGDLYIFSTSKLGLFPP